MVIRIVEGHDFKFFIKDIFMNQRNQHIIINSKYVIVITIYFIIITLFFYLLIFGISPKSKDILPTSEIEKVDLSQEYVYIDSQAATWYQGKFYEPRDFMSTTPIQTDSNEKYGTYHIKLSLPANKTYGITGLTADYAQKVYINGVLVSEVGKTSDNLAQFIPKTDYYSVYFTPNMDTTEIIIQVSYLVHQDGFLKDLYLAEQEVIVERNRSEFFSNGIILGVLLSFVVYFLGMFLTYTERISFLWYALTCFCAALHYSIFFNKDIMILLPNLSWYVSHKIEYLSRLGFYMFLILYVLSSLRLRIKTWVNFVFFGGAGAISLFYLITPSTIYTQYIFFIGAAITIILAVIAVYILRQGYCDKIFIYKENLIVGFSPVLILISWMFEAFSYQREYWYIQPYITMLIVFFNAIALTIQFSRVERELTELQMREREIAENVAMLERMNNMKTDFLQKMAHEIKTPLTVMSGYAQLTKLQIEENEVNEDTTINLSIISAEAKRLSELVSSLMEMPSKLDSDLVLTEISVEELLRYTSIVCRGILEKNENSLLIKGEAKLSVLGNLEMLVQMMINLAANSNKFMENGEFVIEVTEDKDMVSFIISDTGSGIPKEIEDKIFEKGFTTSTTKGLGLSICKEIAHMHKGDIVLYKQLKQGAAFKITIPILNTKLD